LPWSGQVAVCARCPPKMHDGTGILRCGIRIETTSCAIEAEGHSNAMI
jgi:hypothetical protein